MPEIHKLNLRLPADLHADLLDLAAWECTSANAVMVAALRNWVAYRGRARAGLTSGAGNPARGRSPAAPSPSTSAAVGAPVPKVGPNQPCPCGSGQKYKRCHGKA